MRPLGKTSLAHQGGPDVCRDAACHDPRGGVRALHPDRAVPAHHLGPRVRARAAGSPSTGRPSPPVRAWSAPSCRGPATPAPAPQLASALRGWDHLRYEVTEEPSRRARTARAGPTRPPSASTTPGSRRPATPSSTRTGSAPRSRGRRRPGRRSQRRARRGPRRRLGRASSSRSATPATALRCAGCTRWADPPDAPERRTPREVPGAPGAPAAPVRRRAATPTAERLGVRCCGWPARRCGRRSRTSCSARRCRRRAACGARR